MGKYFSNDSDFNQYSLTDNETVDVTSAMPSADNLTQPLNNQAKEILSHTNQQPSTTDEHINMVKQQNDQVREMVETYSEKAKVEFKNQFDKFAPAELFEKLNQLIFVVTDLSNRITRLEQSVNNSVEEPKNETVISDPKDLLAFQERMNMNKSHVTPPQSIPTTQQRTNTTQVENIDRSHVMNELNAIKKGQSTRSLPNDGYTDKSVNLEEMFPDLDDEAYQAGYSAISERKTDYTNDNASPTPGSMRGITGF